MEKTSARRKFFHRNYKRFAAAVIGTAIMTGAALPGIPIFSKALANEKPSSSKAAQTRLLKKDGWHEHQNSWPSSDENQGWYENGRIYYRSDSDRYQENSYALNSPLELVKDYAGKYGFDRYRDSFTVLSQSHHKVSILVITHDVGKRFKVDLVRNYDDWEIVAVTRIS